jgi:hypothetical protein
VTVTAQAAANPPSFALAVTVALPALIPVMSPLSETVAIAASLVDQATFASVASAGAIVAVSWSVEPTFTLAVEGLRLRPVAAIAAEVGLVPGSQAEKLITASAIRGRKG